MSSRSLRIESVRGVVAAGLALSLVSVVRGQLNFVIQELASGTAPSPLYAGPTTTVGDFNGDGFSDVAFREDSIAVGFRVVWGPGFALPYTTVALPSLSNSMYISPRSGDVDDDGYDDLLVGAGVWGGPGASPGVIVIRYGPSLTTETLVTFSLPGGSFLFGWFYEVADLDGNGTSDVVSTVSTSPPASGATTTYLEVLYGPAFSAGTTLSVPAWASGSVFGTVSADGDFSGDGLPDVLGTLQNGTTGAVVLFPGPSFSSTTATVLAYPVTTVGLGLLWAGDLTGDGVADAVLTNQILNPFNGIYQLEVLGIPSPAFGVTVPLLGPWGSPTFGGGVDGGDVDGDGLRDLAVGYFGGSVLPPTGAIRLGFGPYFSTTQGFFGPSFGAALGGQIFLEDVDGDGFREVISPAAGDNKVMVYRPRTLTVSGTGVSLSAGGTVTLSIDASPSHGGEAYLIACSTTGTYPGTFVGSIRVPIIVDAFTFAALAVVNSPVFANFAGSLDANGEATATLAVPAGLFANPALLGLTVNFADVVLNPAMTEVRVSSNPVAVTLLP